jgi:hypothetical protein
MDLITRFIWTFTLRSYNYMLHHTNYRLYFLSPVLCLQDSVLPFLADESSLHLFSPFLLTGLQSTNNHLKVVLLVPCREHLEEHLSFLVAMQTTLSLLR